MPFEPQTSKGIFLLNIPGTKILKNENHCILYPAFIEAIQIPGSKAQEIIKKRWAKLAAHRRL